MDSQKLNLLPPCSIELEHALLGALLAEGDLAYTVVGVLDDRDFYGKFEGQVYAIIRRMVDEQRPVDIIGVEEEMRKAGIFEQAGPGFIPDLLRNAYMRDPEGAALQIRDYAVKRRLISGGNKVLQQAYDAAGDTLEVLSALEKVVDESAGDLVSLTGGPIRNTLPALVQEIAEREYSNGITGVDTGFLKLNEITAGWQNSDFIILAARPSMGKTALGLSLAKNAAAAGTAVGVFSLEMSEKQLLERLLSSEAMIEQPVIRAGGLNNSQKMALGRAGHALESCMIVINDDAALSPIQMRTVARKWKREHAIGLVIIDYIQLMRDHEKNNTRNREQEVSMISAGLKLMAKELDIPVIALAQLSREVEKRPSKRPQLSDLRESGSLEQDADIVAFLYRDEYYGFDVDENGRSTAGLADVIIAKYRNGATGTIKLAFDKRYGRFNDFTAAEPPADIPLEDDDSPF